MASVLIIFGSTAGNTELVVDKVASVLDEKKHKVTIERAERFDPKIIKKCKACVFAGSTYGQGLLQADIKAVFNKYDFDLKKKKCAAIGLGDNKYNVEYVVEAANILEEKIKEKNGKLVVKTLRINKTPVPQLNENIEKWAEELSKNI